MLPGAQVLVLETVYHVGPHYGPEEAGVQVETRFTAPAKAGAEVCVWSDSAGETWAPLEHCRGQGCSQLVLQNRGGAPLELGVHLGMAGEEAPAVLPFAILLPEESARFRPADLAALRLRCPAGACRFVLHLFPE